MTPKEAAAFEAMERAIATIVTAAMDVTDWNTDRHGKWNLDAHVTVTLTVGELRAGTAALALAAEAKADRSKHE